MPTEEQIKSIIEHLEAWRLAKARMDEAHRVYAERLAALKKAEDDLMEVAKELWRMT